MSNSIARASSRGGNVSSFSSPSSTFRFQLEPAPVLEAPGLAGRLSSSSSLSSEPSLSSSLISSVIALSSGFFLGSTYFSSSGCCHIVSSYVDRKSLNSSGGNSLFLTPSPAPCLSLPSPRPARSAMLILAWAAEGDCNSIRPDPLLVVDCGGCICMPPATFDRSREGTLPAGV